MLPDPPYPKFFSKLFSVPLAGRRPPRLESVMLFIVAVGAKQLQVSRIQPALPARRRLDRIDVIYFESDNSSVFGPLAELPSAPGAPIVAGLHTSSRQHLPFFRSIEGCILRISLCVVSSITDSFSFGFFRFSLSFIPFLAPLAPHPSVRDQPSTIAASFH